MEDQEKLYCGIDVSAETLDICYETGEDKMISFQTTNDRKGFSEIIKEVGKNHHFVMENTGVYHVELMFYLHDKQVLFTIENALKIRRFIQMRLDQSKSDKKDARWICIYARNQKPNPTEKPDSEYFECRAINNTIQNLTKEITQLSNRIHVLNRTPYDTKLVMKTLTNILKKIQEEKKKLEKELQAKLKSWQPKLLTIVSSIKGIGKRAAAELIIFTQGFKGMEDYRQLISYAGLSPTDYTSGTSIKRRVRISKQGGKQLRHILYMCAMNAMQTNRSCRELYQRLTAKGKNGKLAIIAVCCKLLRQVFGCVKNGIPYDDNYGKVFG